MVVTVQHPLRWVATFAGLLGMLLLAPANAAANKLSDGWLAALQESPQRIVWSHAFALRQSTAADLEAQRTRLIAELDTFMLTARLAGNRSLATGLDDWRQTLADTPALPARTPGRFDLPWLGAHLRHDPPLAALQQWGHCSVPAWIEVWHLAGVTRLPWHAGLGLDQALNALPGAAVSGADNAVVITPNGIRVSRGIAAWNHQATPLTPGSRVVLALPAAESSTVNLINQRLPAYLATRLPGDECVVW